MAENKSRFTRFFLQSFKKLKNMYFPTSNKLFKDKLSTIVDNAFNYLSDSASRHAKDEINRDVTTLFNMFQKECKEVIIFKKMAKIADVYMLQTEFQYGSSLVILVDKEMCFLKRLDCIDIPINIEMIDCHFEIKCPHFDC